MLHRNKFSGVEFLVLRKQGWKILGIRERSLANHIWQVALHFPTGKSGLFTSCVLFCTASIQDIKTQEKWGKIGNVYRRIKEINKHLVNTST